MTTRRVLHWDRTEFLYSYSYSYIWDVFFLGRYFYLFWMFFGGVAAKPVFSLVYITLFLLLLLLILLLLL